MSNQCPMANYRQEIRGITAASDSATAIAGIKSVTNCSSTANTSGQNVNQQQQENKQAMNRLSRLVHPQLHQQHLKNLWKHYLYELQQRAPTPKRVVCPFVIRSRPAYYGREFHGIMSRDEAEQILLEEDGVDGRYLIRESSRQKSQMTLSLRFNGQTKNFRLFYQNGKHYVNDMKRFDTVHDLVADGLITLYVELHAADYIANLATECRYEESPYMTLHKDRIIHIQQRHLSGAKQRQQQQQPAIKNQTSAIQNRKSLNLDDRPRSSSTSSSDHGHQKQHMQIKPIPHEELITNQDDEPVTPGPLPPPTLFADGGAGLVESSVDFDNKSSLDIRSVEKAHHFRTHTFIGHPWCDFCGNFIWGLIGQGVRCEDCGFGAHRKCSESVPNDCCPDLRHIRRIFGIDLTTFCKASNSLRPFLVEQCIAEVERRGLRAEGLYRACGSSDEIEFWKNRFETDWEQTPLDQVQDINVITGVLKLYLRLLPIPLITFDSYQYFIDAAKRPNQTESINGLREASNHLPAAHYQTLKYLIIHLNKVCAYEDYNLMSAKNLGLIFGQTLIYTPNIPMMFQMNCWEYESRTIELMILFYNKIFVK